ncbi:MAG: hypothetical protein ACE5FG_13415 [Myxococcota bacterium]
MACSAALFMLLCTAALSTATARAAATLTVLNLDSAGEGFNDPTPVTPVGGNMGTTLGEQRLIAFRHAATLWSAVLSSDVEIKIGARFDPLPCSASEAVLGQAGPQNLWRDFSGAPLANTWYPEALANKLAGVDVCPPGTCAPPTDDIGAEFNSSLGTTCAFPDGWYFGLDGNPPGFDIDFVTTVLHEIAHGLGFLTIIGPTGTKFFGADDIFSRLLEDHSTGMLWPPMTDSERAASSIDTGDLHWTGAAAVVAAGSLSSGVDISSGHIEMYAPSPYETGSSVSHFSTSLVPDDLMEPFDTGPIHALSLAAALLGDLGWSVCGNGIPEPPELCDDGNVVDGDGCPASCGFAGPAVPQLPGWARLALALFLVLGGGALLRRFPSPSPSRS